MVSPYTNVEEDRFSPYSSLIGHAANQTLYFPKMTFTSYHLFRPSPPVSTFVPFPTKLELSLNADVSTLSRSVIARMRIARRTARRDRSPAGE